VLSCDPPFYWFIIIGEILETVMIASSPVPNHEIALFDKGKPGSIPQDERKSKSEKQINRRKRIEKKFDNENPF